MAQSSQALYTAFQIAVLCGAFYWLLRLLRAGEPSSNGAKRYDAASRGVLAGVLGGIVVRLAFLLAPVAGLGEAVAVMSIGFLFITPIVMGVLTVRAALQERSVGWGTAIVLPWASVALAMLVAGLVGIEGLICIIMALPLWLVLGSLGGVAAKLSSRGRNRFSAAVFVFLPLAVTGGELQLRRPDELRRVENSIVIDAPAEQVWPLIRSVDEIQPEERKISLYTSMGFPRPLAATISGEGVGAIRKATFSGGVEFTEKVTEWSPGHSLAFSIRANTDTIPRTTLDEHVTIGGPFFDTLNGRYEIEMHEGGSVTLHLSSTHRLSTLFNAYAGLWTDAIMSSIQQNILEVIKLRAERAGEAVSK